MSPGEDQDPRRYFHGTSRRKAARLRQAGFQDLGAQIFLTSFGGEADSYGEAVVEVRFQPRNPLQLDSADGPFPAQLETLGFPFEIAGGWLGPRTLSALRAAGHDALIVSYPEDLSDPSDPKPARRIARALDPTVITVL